MSIFYASFIILLTSSIELQYLFLPRQCDLDLLFFKLKVIKNHLHNFALVSKYMIFHCLSHEVCRGH